MSSSRSTSPRGSRAVETTCAAAKKKTVGASLRLDSSTRLSPPPPNSHRQRHVGSGSGSPSTRKALAYRYGGAVNSEKFSSPPAKPKPNEVKIKSPEKPRRGRPPGSGNKRPPTRVTDDHRCWAPFLRGAEGAGGEGYGADGNERRRGKPSTTTTTSALRSREFGVEEVGVAAVAAGQEVGVLTDRDTTSDFHGHHTRGTASAASGPAGDTMEVNLQILRDFSAMKDDVDHQKHLLARIENAISEERTTTNSADILRSLDREVVNLSELVSRTNVEARKMLYILDTAHIVEEYRQILRRPVVNTFSRQKHLEDRMEARRSRHENYLKFTKAAREYATFEIPTVKEDKEFLHEEKASGLLKSVVDEIEGSTCRACGQSEKFSFDDEFGATRTCLSCFAAEKITTLTTSCSDVERVSISGSRCTTDRRLAYRECINQYQGKQTCEIPQVVYDNVKSECVKLGFVDNGVPNPFRCVTKDHVVMILRDFGHTRQIENVNLIYRVITGNELDDITHLENVLLRDYETLMAAHAVKVQQGVMKKRCLTTPDVIYKILRKHGHSCARSDFANLRGGSSQNNDDVTEELFRELGWNHVA